MPSAAAIGGSSRLPNLPAGFRFHPTDEELIVHYLMNQAAAVPCPVPIIAEVNIYQCNPWDLPAKALFGENEWYFFSPRDRKYPNGARPNRAAGSGYWKATGTDKAILSSSASAAANSSSSGDLRVGVKKALVFYSGKPPRGGKTDWIMHEYRLTSSSTGGKSSKPRVGASSSMRLDDWVLCRIYKKSNDFQLGDQDQESTVEEDSLTVTTTNSSSPINSSDQKPPVDHDQFRRTAMAMMTKSCSLTDLLNTIDCSALSEMMLLDAPAAEPEPPHHQQSPLIYPTTTTAAAAAQTLNNYDNNLNNSNSHVSNFPFVVDATSSLDHNNNNNNGGLKRKRTMVAIGGGAESLDDGGSYINSFSNKKLKQLLPSDSRSGGHYFAAGSMSSYYCNQQLADTTASNSTVFYQYSSSSNPFLSHHQMLLSSHLEMQ